MAGPRPGPKRREDASPEAPYHLRLPGADIGDPEREAALDDLARFRTVIWDTPGSYLSRGEREALSAGFPGRGHFDDGADPFESEREYFDADELNWLEGRYDDEVLAPDAYLARKAPRLTRALDDWVMGFPGPGWELLPLSEALGFEVWSLAGPPAPLPLPFLTPDELMNGSTDTFTPILINLAYRGLKTLIVGQSKAGKSYTTLARCAEAVQAGHRVLYLSEEPRATVIDKMKRFGLDKAGESFRVLLRVNPDIRNLKWAEIAHLVGLTVGHGYDLVVVDTARPWFDLEGEGSNSEGSIGPAIDALTGAAGAGAAIVLIHQSPWTGKRARGSTEFHAASDLIFHIDGEGKGPRTVKYVGGRVEEVPEVQTIRITETGSEDLGKMQHRTAERLDEVLRLLEEHLDDGLTVERIADLTDYSERAVNRYLARLEEASKVTRRPGENTPLGRSADVWFRANEWVEHLFGNPDEDVTSL